MEFYTSSSYQIKNNRNYITDEQIIKKVMKSFPESEIFFRIITDYGEVAYKAKNGVVKQLKKKWNDL